MGLEEILKSAPNARATLLGLVVDFGTATFTFGDDTDPYKLYICELLTKNNLLTVIDKKEHEATYRLPKSTYEKIKSLKPDPPVDNKPKKPAGQAKKNLPTHGTPTYVPKPREINRVPLQKPFLLPDSSSPSTAYGAPLPEKPKKILSAVPGLEDMLGELAYTFELQTSRVTSPGIEPQYDFRVRAMLLNSANYHYIMALKNWNDLNGVLGSKHLPDTLNNTLLLIQKPERGSTPLSASYIAEQLAAKIWPEFEWHVVRKDQERLLEGIGQFANPVGAKAFVYFECAGRIEAQPGLTHSQAKVSSQ
ncbi:MAG: hypothetical protein V1702_01415 [Candidatus Woesearchaeota archaeon]